MALAPASSFASESPRELCEKAKEALAEQAQKSQQISIIAAERVATDAAGVQRRNIELRWHAFAQEFVIDLVPPQKPQGDETEPTVAADRQLFAGAWRGHSAELVLFWRWPSGVWEGDIKAGRELYSVRSSCEQRLERAPEHEETIYFIDYPEKPQA